MSSSFKRSRGMLPGAPLALFALSMVVASPAARALPHSANIAYVFEFGSGVSDPGFLGSNIFVNAINGVVPPGGNYTTGSGNPMHFTNVPVATIDTLGLPAIAAFDTVLLYEVCTIGSHPNLVTALNTYLSNGLGKVVIYDGDKCDGVNGAVPNYSTFLFPFTSSNPGPRGSIQGLTFVETEPSPPNTLTRNIVVGEGGGTDAVGDSNTFTSNAGGWCAALRGRNALGVEGIQEGYARTPNGGLAIWNGQDNWFTFGPFPFQKKVFDNILDQPFKPDFLPCGVPVTGIRLDPLTATNPVGTSHTVTATVSDNNGNPIAGVLVTFLVTSGPNAGVTGTAPTGPSGQATFTYSDVGGAGTDTLIARFTDSVGGIHNSNLANKTWLSATPPACALTGVIDGPPRQILITVQDTDDGLQSIVVTEATNCSVAVPPFAPGSTDPLVVTATKIDQSQPAVLALRITDTGGNVTDCDPEVAGQRAEPARGFGCSIGSGMGSAGMVTLLVLLAAGAILRRRRA